jgi:hypothetical protein
MPLLLAVAQEAHPDYDDTLLIPAIVLFAIALLYAIVAAWIVTPKMRHE